MYWVYRFFLFRENQGPDLKILLALSVFCQTFWSINRPLPRVQLASQKNSTRFLSCTSFAQCKKNSTAHGATFSITTVGPWGLKKGPSRFLLYLWHISKGGGVLYSVVKSRTWGSTLRRGFIYGGGRLRIFVASLRRGFKFERYC